MIIKPISHYTDKRKYKLECEREPNGRPRRSGAQQHLVYILCVPSLGAVKVGRTHNFDLRMSAYRSRFGFEPVCIARLIVGDEETSKRVERDVIAIFKRVDQRHKLEWFETNLVDLPSRVAEAERLPGVKVVTNSFSEAHRYSAYEHEASQMRRAMFGHNADRTFA